MSLKYPNSSDPDNRLLAKLLQNGVGPEYYVPGDTTWMILRKLLTNQATGISASSSDSERNLIAKLLRNNAQAEGGGGGGGGGGTDYRYIRMTGLANTPTNYAELAYFDLWDADGNRINPTMTSATTPSPYVISASGHGGTAVPYYAFTQTFANRWQTPQPATNQWIQIDLGAGNEARPHAVGLKWWYSYQRFWPTLKIAGSNTGDFSGEEEDLWFSPTFNDKTFACTLSDDYYQLFWFEIDYSSLPTP